MDGIQDMGGMHGFGALDLAADDEAFHAEWEGRVFAMNWAIMAAAGLSLDAGRAGIESLPPADYLALPYFGRWFSAMCNSLVASGIFSDEQMQLIQRGEVPGLPAIDPAAAPTGGVPRRGLDMALQGNPPQRRIDEEPGFHPGDRVRGRTMHPATHTRLPRYVRGRRGAVVSHRGVHVFPDSNALGLGENPCHLYAVRFAARELWGDTANPHDSVTLDLWEPYLEPA